MEFSFARNTHNLFLSGFLVFLFFLLVFPSLSNALRPFNDENLSENSSPLVIEKTALKSNTHLQPIDDNLLEELSPTLVATPKVEISIQEYNQILNQEFEQSICFKRCHLRNDFHPSDNTAKQWRLLIEKDGHAIFGKIHWENPQQKEHILNYLLMNARKLKPDVAGIGVW